MVELHLTTFKLVVIPLRYRSIPWELPFAITLSSYKSDKNLNSHRELTEPYLHFINSSLILEP